MEVECFKIRLKPNSDALLKEWASHLNQNIQEVRNLLKEEGMAIESVFREQSGDGDFLVYYLRALDLKKTREISRASQHPIDVFHRKVMAQISGEFTRLDCLFDAAGE